MPSRSQTEKGNLKPKFRRLPQFATMPGELQLGKRKSLFRAPVLPVIHKDLGHGLHILTWAGDSVLGICGAGPGAMPVAERPSHYNDSSELPKATRFAFVPGLPCQSYRG
jgi:hypothetical protein